MTVVDEVLLRHEFAWPDLAGRRVLLVGLGEGDVATGALALHPAIRAAARVEFAELRGPSPQAAEGLTCVRRASTGRLVLIEQDGLAEELATLEHDVLIAVDLGGPTEGVAGVRRVLDLLRRSGREGLYAILGPGAQGAFEAEQLEGILAALALTETYAGASPLEPVRSRLRRATGRSAPERIAAFLGHLGTKPGEVDGLGRVQVPGNGFPRLPQAPLGRMLVFRAAGEPALSREEALALVLRVSDPEAQADIARTHPAPRVRLQAALLAQSDAVWVALLQADPEAGVRREAARQVRRIPALTAAAAGDADAEVRALARRRLLAQKRKRAAADGDRATQALLALGSMLGPSGRNPALAVALALVMVTALVGGGWLLNGSWRAAEYFANGARLEEGGDPTGLLWYARAVERRPSSAGYREAAARVLLGRPSLAFGRPLGPADHVAVGADGSVVALATGRLLRLDGPVELPSAITDLSFAPDSGVLAVGLQTGGVWVLSGPASLKLPHPHPVTRVRAGTRGRVATADRKGVFRLWEGDRLLGQGRPRGPIMALDPERGRWGVIREGDVEVWTLGRAEPVLVPRATQPFRSVRLDPAGQRLATLDAAGLAELWEPLTLGWSRRAAGREVSALEFLPDGREVVALEGQTARATRTVGAPRPQVALLPGEVRDLAFSADGSAVAIWGPGGARVARSTALRRHLEALPDLDEPPHLLELEAWIYTGKALGWNGSPEPLGKADLAVAWEEWDREGEAHARECAYPSANLWLLMRR